MDFKLIAQAFAGPGRRRDAELEASEDHDLFIANGRSAKYTEITRAGGVWSVTGAAGTPLVVIPTTLCILELYNQPQSGMVMEVLDLFLFHLLGTAVLHNLSLWAEVTAPKAAPTLAAYVIGSHSGREPYTPVAGSRVVPALATTVIAGGWRPFGTPNANISTALPGEAFSAPVDGKLLVPPGCSLAITAVDALATASSVQLGATWNEHQLTVVR